MLRALTPSWRSKLQGKKIASDGAGECHWRNLNKYMDYEVTWEDATNGFYARFTGWVTPESAARLAHEFTSDPRYLDLRYAIIDLTESPGHTFRRDDRNSVANSMVASIGAAMSNRRIIEVAIATEPRMLNYLETYAGITTRPFRIFPTLAEARAWLADQSMSLRHLADR